MLLPPRTAAEFYWYQKDIDNQKKIARLKHKVNILRDLLKTKTIECKL